MTRISVVKWPRGPRWPIDNNFYTSVMIATEGGEILEVFYDISGILDFIGRLHAAARDAFTPSRTLG